MRKMGEGDINSKICLVGEAYGTQEERQQKPFVGSAGEELWKIMHILGVARCDCYITNVVNHKLQHDDFTSLLKFSKDKTGIETATYKEYKAGLAEELKQVKSNIIVAFGNNALYTLVGYIDITKRRGSIYESTLLPGRKVIACIHPAALLNRYEGGKLKRANYLYTHFIRMDLKKALLESAYPEIKLPERNIVIGPSYIEAVAYLNMIKNEHKRVAFDIEVMNEEVSCISFAHSASDVISIPFISHGNDYMNPEQELDIWLLIASILEDSSIEKIGQNSVFDASFLYRKMGIKTRNIQDTMVAQAILYPDFPKGLDFITSMWTNEPYYKDEGKKWFKMGGSERNFWIYNAKDSAVCIEAFPKQVVELTKQGNIETYKRQVALIPILIYMQERGLKIDIEGLRSMSEKADIDISRLRNDLDTVAGMPLNPNSPKQLIEYFYINKKIPAYFNKGSMTTDDNAMRRLARKGIREAVLIRDIRKLRKLKGTYLDVTLSKDNRLRSAMNPVGTKNGRLSSSEDIFDEGTNIQNLPDIMRKFVIPDEGMVMYEVDLSQGENRIVAYIAPEPIMRDAFETGQDVHSLTGALISGLTAEEVKRQDKAGIKCPLGTGDFTLRFWGKKANHGLNYDLGYKSFALKYDMIESDAKFIVDRYHQVYPGVRLYHSWIRAMLQKNRTIKNPFGRVRLYLDRWGDDLFKESYNFIPQSTVADIIIDTMLYIYYRQDIFASVDLINQIHDSLVFQIPLDRGWAHHAIILYEIKKRLEQKVKWHNEEFSIPVDISMCMNLSKKGKREVIVSVENLKGLDNELFRVYTEQRASGAIQEVDSNISDSILSAEEVEFELGDV